MVQDEAADGAAISSSEGLAAGRLLLFGGIAAACALGAAFGLWARPSEAERPGGHPKAQLAAAPAGPDRGLAIVVDDTPAPIGAPLEVLSRTPRAAAPASPPAPPAAPEPMAPKAPPSGLLKAVAPAPAAAFLAPAAPARVAPPAGTAKAASAPERKVQPAARPAPRTVRAKAVKPKPERRARDQRLAESKPAEKPRHGLSALIASLAPHHAAADPSPAAKPAKAARPKPAEQETRLARTERPKPPRAAQPAPRGGGRCVSADPGEALACGDPTLGAAERRLDRAYREAAAAGVPTTTLERQQQRWRAARAAAAREAPWAVREVYQARIAELQDQARDARGN